MAGDAALLVLILTATLLAFGGIYPWALPPILAAVTLLAWRARRRAPRDDDTRVVDWAIAALIAAIAIQLVPLPAPLRSFLSPNLASAAAALRPDAGLGGQPLAPLTLDARATWQALVLAVSAALTYRAARNIFSIGSVRQVCRALAVVAAVFAIEAVVQRAVSPALIYGVWPPQDPGARPFGPVVNRNHFAAWLLMAGAVVTGYLVARVSRRIDTGRGGLSLRALRDSLAEPSVIWTGIAAAIVSITVIAAQSRSAIVGLAVSMATLFRHVGRWGAGLALAIGVAIFVAVGPLDRVAETLESRGVSRTVIWTETLPMVSDFPLTGVGAGAFGRAMLIYQQTRAHAPHLGQHYSINHAHNHYLQLAAEGGALLTLPFVAVVIGGVGLVRRRWRDDGGEMRAVRLGAAAGLCGVAVQSMWEVPLTMPAAALLAATLAALATYRRAGIRD